ncbi:MAG: AAA family ATPase [Candidatus Korobacteraceae bacterium]|jgi:type II secretory pathway predicted ATPase ExeA
MYKDFYGLRDNPFRLNPDPRYLCLNTAVQEAISAILYGIRSRKGILLLIGEVGSGKTTLINLILDRLQKSKVTTGFIFNARENTNDFLELVLTDLGIEYPAGSSRAQMLTRLNQFLLERSKKGQLTALIIDEAQNLSPEVLEEVRLLTNLETSTEKLLQVVLSGQPELVYKLVQPRLRQLCQRIAFHVRLSPLTSEQSREYILLRLAVAGADQRKPIFNDDALKKIHNNSRGIPRLINLLCEHSLLHGFVDEMFPISGETVEKAMDDLVLSLKPSSALIDAELQQ